MTSFSANGEKTIELCHEFVKQHSASQAITGAREVRIIALPEPRLHPLAHCSGTAHGIAPIPKGAAVGLSDIALDFAYLIQVRKWHSVAMNGMFAIRRTNEKNAGHR